MSDGSSLHRYIGAINNKRSQAALIRAGFSTTGEILACPPRAFNRRTNCSLEEEASIRSTLSRCRLPVIKSVAELVAAHDTTYLTLGASGLDNLLAGSLSPGTVFEIVGEASSGKSHCCLQLCLQVQLDPQQGGLGGSALYISSEGSFPVSRLSQLAYSRYAAHADVDAKHMSDHVMLATMNDFIDLDHAISYTVPGLATQMAESKKPLRLVAIDSIAAPIRSEYSDQGLIQRGKDLGAFAWRLKRLAAQHGLVVVVVNQVSDGMYRPMMPATVHALSNPPEGVFRYERRLDISYQSQMSFFAEPSHGAGQTPRTAKKHAALGLSWANMIDSRLFLSRTAKRRRTNTPDVDTADQVVRSAHIVFSSSAPRASVEFVITEQGLESLSEQATLEQVLDGTPTAPLFPPLQASDSNSSSGTPSMSQVQQVDMDEERLWEQVGPWQDVEMLL